MMDLNMINIFSYAIVFITVISMIFGVYAYMLYKAKEMLKRKKRQKTQNSGFTAKEYEKYLFFEYREMRV
jgi:hypothetical protein